MCSHLGAILASDKDLLGLKVIFRVVAALELDLAKQVGCRAGLGDIDPAGSDTGLSWMTSALGCHAPLRQPLQGHLLSAAKILHQGRLYMEWQERWGTWLPLMSLTLQVQIRPGCIDPSLQEQGGDWVGSCGVDPAEMVLMSTGKVRLHRRLQGAAAGQFAPA